MALMLFLFLPIFINSYDFVLFFLFLYETVPLLFLFNFLFAQFAFFKILSVTPSQREMKPSSYRNALNFKLEQGAILHTKFGVCCFPGKSLLVVYGKLCV